MRIRRVSWRAGELLFHAGEERRPNRQLTLSPASASHSYDQLSRLAMSWSLTRGASRARHRASALFRMLGALSGPRRLRLSSAPRLSACGQPFWSGNLPERSDAADI